MKKVLVSTLALAMLVGAMTINAGAAYGEKYSTDGNYFNNPDNAANSTQKGTTAGNPQSEIGTAEVPVKIKTQDTTDTGYVWAVSYDVTELQFTYVPSGTKIWNPDTLMYETPATGSWDQEGKAEIKVTNYSNVPINVTAEVTQTVETGRVTLDIYDKAATTGDQDIALDSADAVMNQGVGTATSGVFTFTITGTPLATYDDFTEIASVTLTVTDARPNSP